MPQLIFRGIGFSEVCKISETLIDQLADVVGCPADYFTIEHFPSTFIIDGGITNGYPFVEVAWFDRGQEIQDKAAEFITQSVKSLGYTGVDVYFTALNKISYYENGKHF